MFALSSNLRIVKLILSAYLVVIDEVYSIVFLYGYTDFLPNFTFKWHNYQFRFNSLTIISH
jgi:hypothetical protein